MEELFQQGGLTSGFDGLQSKWGNEGFCGERAEIWVFSPGVGDEYLPSSFVLEVLKRLLMSTCRIICLSMFWKIL